MTATLEKGRIVSGSAGSFLTPPGHPEQVFEVETDLRRAPHNRGSMNLSTAAECEWLDGLTRAQARAKLDGWARPPLDHPAVVEWVRYVLSYFKGCYRGTDAGPYGRGEWAAESLTIDGERDPLEHADEHAGVHFVRGYYPEFQPSREDFEAGGYGRHAASVWYADVETRTALVDKIRNSDAVRLTAPEAQVKQAGASEWSVEAGGRSRRAYSAEQAAGWALDPSMLDDGTRGD